MTHATDISTLVRWMAGDFSNQAQALDNPPFFAHIRVCMRPLPKGFLPGACLFLEQAYDFALSQPYRLRVLEFLALEVERISESTQLMQKINDVIDGF